ncbi:MAG: hypothetical protein ABFS05_00700 [Bacteroidota bacterium]
MKNLQYLLLLLTASFVFSGCSNDVDINASYQDIVVVYGILDPNDDTTYLKINKAFLGPDNALIMAQVKDSSEFTESLSVKMWPEDNPSDIIHFDTITLDQKDPGIFYNPYQVLYCSPFIPAEDTKYQLQIIYNNMEVTSETNTIESFQYSDITKPGFAKAIGFNYELINPVIWNRKEQAPRYDITIRFHYKEVWEGQEDTVFRFFDWHRDTKKSTIGDEVESYYNGSTFFNALEKYVPYEDAEQEAKVLHRYSGLVEFIVEAGGVDLNTYMEVNEPSSSIIQDRPQYSNINNGVGIFSSRTRAVKTKKLNDETRYRIKENHYWLKFEY